MAKLTRTIETPVKGATMTLALTVDGPDLLICANIMKAAFNRAAQGIVAITDASVTARDAVIEALETVATAPPEP